MAKQSVPSVSDRDVERIVRRDFAAARVTEVLAVLDEYGKESWQREPARFRLADLRLAAGCIDALRSQIETAKRDYRDVLGSAEYPGYSSRTPGSEQIPADEEQRIMSSDWHQYQEWLER